MTVQGVEYWTGRLTQLQERITTAFFIKIVADLVRIYVHIITGFLQSSVKDTYEDMVVVEALYASYEMERGGSHDFVELALNTFDPQREMEIELRDIFA